MWNWNKFLIKLSSLNYLLYKYFITVLYVFLNSNVSGLRIFVIVPGDRLKGVLLVQYILTDTKKNFHSRFWDVNENKIREI